MVTSLLGFSLAIHLLTTQAIRIHEGAKVIETPGYTLWVAQAYLGDE